ncbi:hypothetical protein SDC9_103481 [bioreactor metagenome]|uniref:Uncharacterized protein n=1 Tax=bioreactor metagenome TaxID=1076179 RepID=A0A645ATU5_9ZZZZ|nr:hypothetical protein [Oscillospiraceae bacterium]
MAAEKTKDKKETKNSQTPDNPGKEINESELENVSGGLWNITIWDTCENAFVADKCFANIWGQCPKLIVESKSLSELNQYTYCFTCTKGCFAKLKYMTNVPEGDE